MQKLGIGKDRFINVKASYIANGLTTRVHGNSKRRPHNALTFEEVQNLVKFLRSYAEQHGILLPGRIPGYKRDDLQLLPSSTTVHSCMHAGVSIMYLHCVHTHLPTVYVRSMYVYVRTYTPTYCVRTYIHTYLLCTYVHTHLPTVYVRTYTPTYCVRT